jgi:small subunit ribosomal protein S16
MLRIRLKRTGKSNSASYRVVVAERSAHPQSEGKENLGHYNPTTDPKQIDLKKERIEYWLNEGAQPSNTVHNLLIEEGIIEGDKRKAVAVGDEENGEEEGAEDSDQ